MGGSEVVAVCVGVAGLGDGVRDGPGLDVGLDVPGGVTSFDLQAKTLPTRAAAKSRLTEMSIFLFISDFSPSCYYCADVT